MNGKVYTNPVPLIRAAIRRIGGRLITYDGSPTLLLVKRGASGQIVNVYLNPEEAADHAHLKYCPRTP